MSPQYPQDPNRPQEPPPGYVLKKKTHKFRNFVVLPFVGLIALIVVISAASGGGGGTSPSAATSSDPTTTAPARQPQASTTPSAKAPTTKAPTKVPTTQAPKATQPPAKDTCTGSRNDPCPVKLGVAFTVGKHTMAKGWRLKTEEYVGTKLIGTIKMTDPDGPSTAFFTVKFLNGSSVRANFQCSSSDLETNQSEDIECYNMSDTEKSLAKGTYDRITAEADF